MSDKCKWPKCKSDSDIIWLDADLCMKHWEKVCEMDREKAEIKLKIKKMEKEQNV